MVKYRVILKVSYYETWFDFDTPEQATYFATTALRAMVSSDDTAKKQFITIQVINTEFKEDDESDSDS